MNTSSIESFDLTAMVEMMRSFKVKDDLRKSRAYFDILTMEPCKICGEKIEYHEKPYEHFVMCRHIASHIPTKPVDDICPFPGTIPLDVMPVVFK